MAGEDEVDVPGQWRRVVHPRWAEPDADELVPRPHRPAYRRARACPRHLGTTRAPGSRRLHALAPLTRPAGRGTALPPSRPRGIPRRRPLRLTWQRTV